MLTVRSEDARKWINFFVALVSVILCYTVIVFLGQVGEWFDLEAKVRYYEGISQGVGILSGLVSFVVLTKKKASATFLKEVYDELVKVVWPERETVVRVTFVVIVGVAVLSSIFVGADYVFRQLLELVY